MPTHWLDRAWSTFSRQPALFAKGWGALEPLDALAAHLRTRPEVEPLALKWRGDLASARSPFALLPDSISTVQVKRLRPVGKTFARLLVPPSWGDEGFGMRTYLFGALARSGIEVWLLEGAYFGARAFPGIRGLALPTVADFMTMGLANVVELRALAATARADGLPTGIAGYSMAGMLAGLVSATVPFELPVAALVPSENAGPVFLGGPLGARVDYEALGPSSRARLAALFEAHGVCATAPPLSTRRVVVVTRRDGLVPPSSQQKVAQHWNVTPMWLDSGHLGAYVFERSALRRAVLGGLGLVREGEHHGAVDDST